MNSPFLWSEGSLPRFMVFSGLVHLFLLCSTHLLGYLYSRPQFAVETAEASVDVIFIEKVTEEAVEPQILRKEIVVANPPLQIQNMPLRGAVTEVKPNYMRNPAPVYPREARQNGWEGVVLLEVLVNKSGETGDVIIKQSSGYNSLDRAALQAVKSWRFRPARLENRPIESSVQIPIRFKMENRTL